MYPCFDVEGISAERLLSEWKWLAPGEFSLLAVNAFGDLFLQDARGSVHRLDVTRGTISAVATSTAEFRDAAKEAGKKRDWFLEERSEQAARKGCSPRKGQCVGGKIPIVFAQSASMPDNMYVADLYEYVSFMGDLHHQMKNIPDGGQVRIKVQPRPIEPDPTEN
ncbi:MAG: hypothetical protein WB729_09915 [Candidatus Sulfotelmatobacter sp.]